MESLLERARVVAENRDAGASEIVRGLLPLLEEALGQDPEVTIAVARIVCATQPSMAPVWNACAAAVADRHEPGRFADFRQQVTRQRGALLRIAAGALNEVLDDAVEPTIVTWSYSASVAEAISAAARARPLTVICAEGRPRFEGRRLASVLATSGAHVILTTDAGATAMLDRAAAVVVGADALVAQYWVNKVGTRALAAVAAQFGHPVIVIASRDKTLGPTLEPKLSLPLGDPTDVWSPPQPGIETISPVFERIPADLATWFATDAGLLTAADLPAFARSYEADARLLISALGRV